MELTYYSHVGYQYHKVAINYQQLTINRSRFVKSSHRFLCSSKTHWSVIKVRCELLLTSNHINSKRTYLLQNGVLLFGRKAEVSLLACAKLGRLLVELLLALLDGADVVFPEVFQRNDELRSEGQL